MKNSRYEFWDERTVEHLLRRHVTGSLDQLTDELVEAADLWAAGAEQHDDMTAVAVRITA